MTRPPSLEGVCVPLVSPCTPDGAADPRGLAENLVRLRRRGIAAAVLFGTTGEGPLLARAERVAYLTAARGVADGLPLLAVTTAEGADAALEDLALYAELGADAGLLLTPRYYAAAPEGLLALYARVAERSPLPLLAYNMPPRTGVDLGEEGVRGLWRGSAVTGIKDSGADTARMTSLGPERPAAFALLAGSADDLPGQLLGGATGAILAVANLAPGLARATFQAARSGDTARSAQLGSLLARGAAEFARPGVPTIKSIAGSLGLAAGPPRLPLLPLGPEQAQRAAERFADWAAEARQATGEAP